MKLRFRFLRDRARKLDVRVQDAQRDAESATQEAELSRQRHESIQENIVKPLRKAATHNQFAELLRQSLVHKEGGQNA